MHLSKDEHNIHYQFSPLLPPAIEIRSGERFSVATRDASNGQIRPGLPGPVDPDKLLPATGPIAVTDAVPGDALSIHIETIRLSPTGYAWLRPGLGIRAVTINAERYVKAFVVEKELSLPGGLKIPLRPMVGIVGVSPNYDIGTRRPGPHGGNLDCVDITEGNTLWLPVFTPKALLSFGDVHAAMGEGEVSGTGVEIEAEVTATVKRHPQAGLDGPIVSTPEKTAFLASGADIKGAVQSALERAIRWLMRKKKLSEADATITASLAGNARICQLVNGDVTVSFELPWGNFSC